MEASFAPLLLRFSGSSRCTSKKHEGDAATGRVTAAQKIGPSGDRRVINALMNEISDRIVRILRKHSRPG